MSALFFFSFFILSKSHMDMSSVCLALFGCVLGIANGAL